MCSRGILGVVDYLKESGKLEMKCERRKLENVWFTLASIFYSGGYWFVVHTHKVRNNKF